MAGKQLIVSASGFPGTNKTWRFVQQAFAEPLEALARNAGNNTILSGITQIGASNGYTSGYVVYDGEILPFEAGTIAATVTIIETTEAVEYDVDLDGDGVKDILPAYRTRYMRFGTGGVTTFNFSMLSRLKTLKDLSAFTLPADLVHDASYVHTDNNFTLALLDKLNGIATGAQVNVQANWNAATGSAGEILNKPDNFLFVLKSGTVYLDDVDSDVSISVSFGTNITTSNYQVCGNLVSFGTNFNADNDVFWTSKNHAASGFDLLLREVSSSSQTLRFYYLILPRQ